MSTLDQMQAFVAVVEEGSFTAAALQFDISPTSDVQESFHAREIVKYPIVNTNTAIDYTEKNRLQILPL